jgi:hypothetical protein
VLRCSRLRLLKTRKTCRFGTCQASSWTCLSTSHEYWISSSNAGMPQIEASVQIVEEYALGKHGSESWCLRFIA